MKEIFLRIWDINSGVFAVRSFQVGKITNLSHPPEETHHSFNPKEIKSVFEYEGQKHYSSDERAFIQAHIEG